MDSHTARARIPTCAEQEREKKDINTLIIK